MSDFTATPSHPATTPASSNEPIHHHNAEEEKDGDPLQLHGHGHEPSSDTHSQQPTTTTTTSNNTNDDAHSSFNLVGENTWDTFEDYDDDDEEEEKEEDEGKPHSTATNNSPFGSQEEPIVFVQGSPLSTGQQQQRARRTSIHQPVSLKVTAPKVTERRHYDTGIMHCCFGWSRGPCLDGFFCRQCALGYQSHLVTDLATPEERRYDYSPEATNEHLSMRAAVCAPALALDVLLLGFGTALCNIPHRLRINETYNIGESRCWSVFASCCCTSCAVIQQQKFLSNRGHFPGGVCADPPLQERIDPKHAYTSKKTHHRSASRPDRHDDSQPKREDAVADSFNEPTGVFFPKIEASDERRRPTTTSPAPPASASTRGLPTASFLPARHGSAQFAISMQSQSTQFQNLGGGGTPSYLLSTSMLRVADLRGSMASPLGINMERTQTGGFDPLSRSIYLDIKPLDLIFFRSEGLPTMLSRVGAYVATKYQSTAFPHLTHTDFSHVGVVMTTDVLDHPAMIPGVPYVLEATSTSSAEIPDIDGDSFTGVQLRNLEAICNERKESDTMSIALCSLREDVKEEKLYFRSDEEIKALINTFFQKYHKAEYNFNPMAWAYLGGIKAARLLEAQKRAEAEEKRLSKTKALEQLKKEEASADGAAKINGNNRSSEPTTSDNRSDGGNNQPTPTPTRTNEKVFCSSLVASLYKTLGIFPPELDVNMVMPMDYLGFDEDEQVPMVVESPAWLLGTPQ